MAKPKRAVGRPAKGAAVRLKSVERSEAARDVNEDVITREDTTLEKKEEPAVTVADTHTIMAEANSKEEQKTAKPWVDVIQGNRSVSRGMPLGYVAPTMVNGEIIIQIEEEDVAEELDFWENAIILFALGDSLTMNVVKKFMEKSWNFASLPDLFYNDSGYFIARCKSKEDQEQILAQGPYFIFGKPIFLKKWSIDFELRDDLLRVLPLWVNLPNLPLYLWGEKSITKISSAIGKPIVTDVCTAQKIRASYVRMLVEVDITQKPIESIKIRDHRGKIVEQRIEYEWKPKYCHSCLKIGHDCSVKNPGGKPKQLIWKPVALKPIPEEKPVCEQEKETTSSVEVEQEKEITSSVVTPDGPGEEIKTLGVNPPWTLVTSNKADRGKKHLKTNRDEGTDLFNNTFTPLRTGASLIGESSFHQ